MEQPPNRIGAIRKQRKMTQQDLADAIGAHWITVSKLERGKLPLTGEWSEKIAEALKVDESDLALERSPRGRIYIDNVILEGRSRGMSSVDPLPLILGTGIGSTGDALWSLVADGSLYPFFQAGDVLRLVVRVEDPNEFVGRLCLIRPASETETKHYIGFLEKGSAANRFTIRRLSGPPITDITVEILAVIERAIYQPPLTKELQAELGQSS